jgi:acyl-CoA synthetase (NDP forming)
VCYLGGGQVQEDEVNQFHAWKVPVFSTPERATRALAAVYARSCSLHI